MNRKRLPSFYSEPEMIALARAPKPVHRKGLRDKAILATLCSSGLRASELCNLERRDASSSLVFVRSGKFGFQRYVPVSQRAWRSIEAYLTNHPAKPGDRLFRTLDGRPLTRRLLHKIVTGYERQVGLKGGVHVVRHAAATRWLNHGVNLQSVRLMLGHVQIATTSIYLNVATEALVAEYRRCLEATRGGEAR
jgi:integrase/recombinase XerD